MIKKEIMGFFRNFAMLTDYLSYLIFSPFKFKRFPTKINKILLVDLLKIGDTIVTTPVIRAIKEKYPNSELNVLINKNMINVLSGNPKINNIIPYDCNIKKKLKEGDYDLGIILHHGSFEISKLLLYSRVKYRIGCTKAGIMSGKGFFLNRKIKPNFKEQHKIEDNLDVTRSIRIDTKNKKLEIYATKESDEKINNTFKIKDIKDADLKIVIHAGANYKDHEWSNEKFAKIADYLIGKYNAKVILTGGKKDIPLNNEIIMLMKNDAINLAETSIKEFFSIIKKSDLVISVDTSAMHVAAAFDKKIIALFGPGYPKVWYPYTENRYLIYRGRDMKNIKLEDVKEAIDVMLK